MAPNGSRKGKGKTTARAKMVTSGINQRMSLDQDRIKGFISEHISRLIRIYNVCGVKHKMAWDLFYDIIILHPVTTRHYLQFHLRWPQRRSRSSPFREWWAAFRSYMGQMFDKTHDEMNNWRWDNPCAFGDQVDRSNPETTSSGKVKRTGERFSGYSCDHLRSKIEPRSCRQYKPGDCLALRPINWDEIIDEDDDDDNWEDAGAPTGGRSHRSDGTDIDDREGEEDKDGGEKGTGKRKGTKDGKAKRKRKATEERKGKGMGNGHGNGIVKQIPGGDDISRAVVVQL
jgi:hypothetical protein